MNDHNSIKYSFHLSRSIPVQCFQSEERKAYVIGELYVLYASLDDPGQRLELMGLVGNPNVCFDTDDDEFDANYNESKGVDNAFESE